MPRYLIVIGGRELEIEAETLADAQATAMGHYPGETVTGFSQLPEPEPEPETEPNGENTDGD